ncbi:MAG: alpha/beta fold hydrolase [Pseudobdellovibrionaceae bacterium]
MPYITVGQENSGPIELYFEDHGEGQPVLLIHGWPLNGASWEKQTMALLQQGYRVITYDRRGFGRSAKPVIGYDYDTFASDLRQVIEQLDLENVVLVGFSMGTGEVTRYLGKYGSEKISKAVMIGVIPPYLLKTADNPTGVDQKVFDEIKENLLKDRPAYMKQFLTNFYNFKKLEGKRVSEEALLASWNVAVQASYFAAVKCVDSWLTDFRADLKAFDIPTLIMHGDADQILPIKSSGEPLSKLLKNARYVEIKDGPHGVLVTHAEEINKELLSFLGPAPKEFKKAQVLSESRPQFQ